MPLWIFETDTLKAMLADAEHVMNKNTGEVSEAAADVVSEIYLELRSRNTITD